MDHMNPKQPGTEPEKPMTLPALLFNYLSNRAARNMTLVNTVSLLVIVAWGAALFLDKATAADALNPFALLALGSILGTSVPRGAGG